MSEEYEGEPKRRRTGKAPDTVSCSECRRRKTKCTRVVPCGACIDRGNPDGCQLEQRRHPPNFTELQRELQAVTERLRQVEQFVGMQPGQEPRSPGSLSSRTSQPTVVEAVVVAEPLPAQAVRKGRSMAPSGDATLAKALGQFSDFTILMEGKDSEELVPAEFFAPPDYVESLVPTIVATRDLSSSIWAAPLIRTLTDALPATPEVHRLCMLYIKNRQWISAVIFAPQLLKELQEFEVLRWQGRLEEIDPAWLAVLFMVMSLGLISEHELFGPDEQTTAARALGHKYHSAGCGALAAADWTQVPSLRVVQAIIVESWWMQHNDPEMGLFIPGSPHRRARTAVALSHCRYLRLDKLGATEEVMPKYDPALPKQPSSFRRQIALRVWHAYMTAEALNGFVLAEAGSFDSVRPTLCRDSDIGANIHVAPTPLQDMPSLGMYLFFIEVAEHLWTVAFFVSKNQLDMGKVIELETAMRRDAAKAEKLLDSVAAAEFPPQLPSAAQYRQLVRLLYGAQEVRLRRAAIGYARDQGSSDDVDTHFRAALQAAKAIAILAGKADSANLLSLIPVTVLFVLNACTVIIIALAGINDPQEASELGSILSRSIAAIRDHARSSKNIAIASNGRKALDAVSRLLRRIESDTSKEASAGTVALGQIVLELSPVYSNASGSALEELSFDLTTLFGSDPTFGLGDSMFEQWWLPSSSKQASADMMGYV